MTRILIIGATSGIAEQCSRIWAARGAHLFLVGRKLDRLKAIAADLDIRGASKVDVYQLDVDELEDHLAMLEAATKELGTIDIALTAHGTLANQKECESAIEDTLKEVHTNGVATLSLMSHLANLFEVQGEGTIAVLSSVAGDRGRASNYIYGSAKAMTSAFASGLRQRLWRKGVKVLTIKPGFVATPMTERFEKGFLWADPEKVAQQIVKAIDRGRDELYTPRFWFLIMAVIKWLPESLFKRMSF